MKKLIVSCALMVITLVSYAQTYKMYSTRNYHNQLRLNTMTGEVQQIQDDGQSWEICSAREASGDKVGRFCLYETQNMWTFIMLDTYTGKNWQVQFSVKGEDYMFAAPINIFSLAYIIRKSKFPQNPKRSVRFSGKRTKRSVQKRKARNTQKAETKVL